MLFEYEFLEANIYSWKYKKTAFPKPTFTYKSALFLELITNESFITEFQRLPEVVQRLDFLKYFIQVRFIL